jgi:L-threonylcarbamoyladenylate synthase
MLLLKTTDESIRRAADILSGGGLVAFPTETVYGLGANVFNQTALAKIFEVKNRPHFDPLIVHVADTEMLEKTADLSRLDSAARKRLAVLTEKLWPGPLTLVLPKLKTIPDLATAGLSTVAVRLPGHEAARRLIALSGGPVAAPSANPFGYLSPTRAEHVLDLLGGKIDMILDGGPSNVGVESTVLDICGDRPRILRYGGVPAETIEALIGPVADGQATSTDGVTSPGMLKSHYAPRTPLSVYDTPGGLPDDPGAALLFFDGAGRNFWLSARKTTPAGPETVVVLSETGNTLEAAARLFETLHDLDRPDIKRIHAQLAPETSLGRAINDRLKRGSS